MTFDDIPIFLTFLNGTRNNINIRLGPPKKLELRRRTLSMLIFLGVKNLVPLRAKQVSKANLRSEQGGINFTPFVLSPLIYKKKKKKKKIKISHMDRGQLKNVCLLSVVCCLLSVVCCL